MVTNFCKCCLLIISFTTFFCCANAQSISRIIDATPTPFQEKILTKLYDSLIRYNKDSNYAIAQLNYVVAYAKSKDNYGLWSLATTILADHYARIRQYNATSTQLHYDAIELAKKSKNPSREGLAYYTLGRYFYNFNKRPQAFAFFLNAQNILDNLSNNENEVIEFQYYLGNIYNETSNPDKAIFCYKKVLNSSIGNKWFILNAANNIGLIKQQQNDYTTALYYFNITKENALKYHYNDWLPIVNSNIGKALFEQGKTNEAIPFLREGLLAQIQLNDREYANEGLQILVQYYLSKNNLDSALFFVKSMDTNAVHRNKFLLQKIYYATQASIAKYKNDNAATVQWQNKLLLATDSFAQFNDIKVLKDVELKMETQSYLASLKEVQTRAKTKIYYRNFFIVLALISTIFLAVLYTREKKRAKVDKLLSLQKQQLLQTEEKLAKQELEATQQQLKDIVDRLKEKNEIVKQYEEELNKLQPNKTITEVQKQNAFEELNEKTILTADDWDSFKTIFTKLHPHFFASLKQQYPQFTPSEVRVLALQKLNFSSADMAATLGISLDSVKKTKQRLRKKMDGEVEEFNIEEFVKGL